MHISTHVLKLVVISIRYLVRYNINYHSRVYPETSSFSLCILSWSLDVWTCCFPYMHLISRLLSQASYISIIPSLSWHARMGSMSLKPNHCIMITQTVTLWFTPVPFEDVSHFYMYVFRTYSTWTKGTLTVHLSQGNDHTGRIMDMAITIYWHQVMTGLVVLSVQTAWVCSRKIVACRLVFYINTEMTRHFFGRPWSRWFNTLTSYGASWRLKSLPSRLFTQSVVQSRSKKTSKLRVTGLREGISPVTGIFLTQGASNAKNVSIRWCHHDICTWICINHTIIYHPSAILSNCRKEIDYWVSCL